MPIAAAPLAVIAILFLATVIRSAFGFGEALISVPLLALLLPVEVAAPLAVLISITVALIAVIQDWEKIHFRSAVWLVASTMAGIPLGLWMLKTVPEAVVKMVLAVLIAAFSLYSLLGRGHGELRDDRSAWAFGFTAGVLGGAYGMNGPPLVMYGTLRKWHPQNFRATLQGYFLPASVVGMLGYGAAGLWTWQVNRLYLESLPFVLGAFVLGRTINRRMSLGRFLLWVHGGLIGIAGVLMVQAARGW